MHGIKHRGITDTPDKNSRGHKSKAMRDHDNYEVGTVDPSPTPQLSGELSGANKKAPRFSPKRLFCLVGRVGFEPTTKRLKVSST